MDQRGIHGVWSSRWTFILAATGSAVGLGNIWKFPYIAGENGGGAFVLVYLACIAVIGIPILMAEVLIGRRGRMSPINSMSYVTAEASLSKNWVGIGWMGVLSGLFIMSFYSVIAGWALHYTVTVGSGTFEGVSAATAGERFGHFLADKSALLTWHTLFSLMTAVIVAAGVTRGLSAVAKVLMPFLFLALLVLLAYGLVQGNFIAGAQFLFEFRFDKLTAAGVLEALGHAFFTLSLGMGAIMAYGAYMPEKASLGKTVITVGLLDTLVALIAGMAIFPIVFANPEIEPGAGPGLLFVSLPVAFGNMPGGVIFGTLFFVLVSVAAWSSAVSLIEPGVAWLVETKKIKRVFATLLFTLIAWLLGITSLLSFNDWAEFKPAWLLGKTPFDFLDFLTAQVMLPLGGLSIAIFVGWKMNRELVIRETDSGPHPLVRYWLVLIRYISPVLVLMVMAVALFKTFFT